MKRCVICGKEIKQDAKGTWYHRAGVRVECDLQFLFLKAKPAPIPEEEASL